MTAHERPLERWRRRAISIPLVLVGAALYLALAPLLFAVTLAVDVLRRRRLDLTRALTFVGVYFAWELWGLASLSTLWLASRLGMGEARYHRANVRVQTAWGASIYRAFEVVYDLRTVVHGELPPRGGGPLIVFMRHASSADTMLPFWLLGRPLGYELRYVLKAELLLDPCIDVAMQRLPNAFVRRGRRGGAGEVARITALLEGLTPSDAIVIYPEGTRFTEDKRARGIKKLEEHGAPAASELALARSLTRTLSPLRAGPLALLAENAGASLLVVGHTGLEPAGTFNDLTSGGLVGNTVHVCVRSVPFAEVPRDPEKQARLLADLWSYVDRFIAQRSS